MLRVFVLIFIILNTILQKLENVSSKMYHRKWRFSIAMGFQNANENEFHGFGKSVSWLWKRYENISRGV